MLVKYKSDLSRPFDEATTFLNKVEMQLRNLCTGASIRGPSGQFLSLPQLCITIYHPSKKKCFSLELILYILLFNFFLDSWFLCFPKSSLSFSIYLHYLLHLPKKFYPKTAKIQSINLPMNHLWD